MKAVYIHIPFCVRKCLYCDFISGPPQGPVFPFVTALKKEIEMVGRNCADTEPVTSVFFGGGTPTFLNANELAGILDTVRGSFKVADDAEISLECNPGTLTASGAVILKNAGFNRVSIGLQSADDRLLKLLGRIHTRDEFLKAYGDLRAAGFKNINIDVMHALPEQTIEDYLKTLSLVCELGSEHISSYALILEEGTPYYNMVQSGALILPDEDLAADMQDTGIKFLEEAGYRRYEISNFARPGYECRHNLLYWDNGPYLGFGPAAHSSYSWDGKWFRWHNTENTAQYIRAVEAGRLPREELTEIGQKEQRFESVMLGLRKVAGIDAALFKKRFGLGVSEAFPQASEYVKKSGLLRCDDEKAYALNRRGLDILNSVLLQFM